MHGLEGGWSACLSPAAHVTEEWKAGVMAGVKSKLAFTRAGAAITPIVGVLKHAKLRGSDVADGCHWCDLEVDVMRNMQ